MKNIRLTKEQEESVVENMKLKLTLLKDEPDKRDFRLSENVF